MPRYGRNKPATERVFGVPPSGIDKVLHSVADPADGVIASNEKVICFDVEAVATGVGHNDRKPCRVSVVDEGGDILYDAIISVSEGVYDPLTAITGLSREDIARGVPFEEAKASFKATCGPDTVLVGQCIDGDIAWMELEKGVDYARTVDIAKHFRLWNPKKDRWIYFSLARLAYALLKKTIHGGADDSVEDAQVSMRLFQDYVEVQNPQLRRGSNTSLLSARKKLLNMTCHRQFPKTNGGPIINANGCSYKFNKARCFCGQPCASTP